MPALGGLWRFPRASAWFPIIAVMWGFCPWVFAAPNLYLGQALREPSTHWLLSDYLAVSKGAGGNYDWGEADRLVLGAQQHGLKILARIYLQSPGPVMPADYTQALTAAVARYNGDGSRDMPGLRYAVTDWIVDAAFYARFVDSEDPKVMAEFAAAAYRAVRAVDPQARVVIAAGACEPREHAGPVSPAGYQEKFFRQLGRCLADLHPQNLVLGFDLAADLGAYEQLPALADFWLSQLKQSGLNGTQLWVLSLALPKTSEVEDAAEILKLHLVGSAAGLEMMFFLIPLPPNALDGDLEAARLKAQRAQGGVFADEVFQRAASLVGWTDWQKVSLEAGPKRWQLTFSGNSQNNLVAWMPHPAENGEYCVETPVVTGKARVEQMIPEKRFTTTIVEIKDGKACLAASAYPAFIQVEKGADDCKCHNQHP
ncbi:MAG: hypothetical protein HGA76_01485 [Candidatus Firestonebacteria bacterium]|nr:hypothetical protein [Candidatus Firestonebacteria bacterium]